ncbi:hypothetical protein POM88_045712 [Heracleum sosnowskyi]|uniref:Uncharacterized protein n=1 Tax=Heracleum sosnowskyi TaxID=360622 RepID=A0AAD8H711_9APIA|nr:hypothetical protein POM88_045712 [Heracleum sosnowskyi]
MDGVEMYDFSYTEYEEDERVARVSEMYDECENKAEDVDDEGKEEDEVSFHGDSSNMDSSESEAEITPKKKRNIPPPNPPFRLRRIGTKASQTKNTHSPKRTKELARKIVSSSPLKNGGIVVPTAKKGSTVVVDSHGGIVKPFKAPTRVPFKTPLDVQPVRGQKFTSLKTLEAAKYEREKIREIARCEHQTNCQIAFIYLNSDHITKQGNITYSRHTIKH